MTTGRNRAAAAWFVALTAAVVAPSCFRPNIRDGGLLCTDAGVCPEGFHCARNGTCREGAAMACSASAPRVEQLCEPAPGTDCDPVCQSRCDCGRCNMVNGALMCMPPGTRKRGELCNAASDDCVPGNVCVNFCGGNRGARCYRFCSEGDTQDNSLCGGNLCDIRLNPGGQPEWILCEPPLESCNPIGDNRDCVADPTTLGCYVGPTGSPVCDCRGTAAEGEACGPYNSCVPGFSCVGFQVGAICLRTCRLAASDCPAPTVCTMLPGNDTFGFCRS